MPKARKAAKPGAKSGAKSGMRSAAKPSPKAAPGRAKKPETRDRDFCAAARDALKRGEPDAISDTIKKAKNRGRWLSIVAVNGHSPIGRFRELA